MIDRYKIVVAHIGHLGRMRWAIEQAIAGNRDHLGEPPADLVATLRPVLADVEARLRALVRERDSLD